MSMSIFSIKYKYIGFCSIIFFVFLLWTTIAHSQLIGHDEPIIISNPETPGPQEDISLHVDFFGSDLNRANIKWYKNGTLLDQGVGLRDITVQTGILGSQTTIRVDLTTGEGDLLSKTLVLRPTSLEIVWEADTYIPPFYKGKALPTSGSIVKLVAIPEFITSAGVKIPKKDLFYKWQAGGGNIFLEGGEKPQGKGKYFAFATAPLLSNAINISLEVSSQNRSLVKEYSTSIRTENPEALFYKEDPLLGTRYEKALPKNFLSNDGELTVRVEPFYLSTSAAFGGEYKWELNGKSATPHENNPRVITLVRGQDIKGKAELKIDIINIGSIKQRIQDLLIISF